MAGYVAGKGNAADAVSSSSWRCLSFDFLGKLRRERLQVRCLEFLVFGSGGEATEVGGKAKEGEGVGEALARKDREGEDRWRWRRRLRRAVSRVSRI